ncbi:family 43 glycosylhydrolase [Rosettibacter firmus]|uniref:family 43 glycosylhydrolase n=1 Tax=Rosettibacter firmus TaxID=3111522 RepID=UPI00336C0386
MRRIFIILIVFASSFYSQSISFKTYMNPIIPGDHPDPTLTKVGKYFYTSGSSFNPTPKIYRSTDLVHWEVIAQPVSASWSGYGDSPGGGIWGGHMVYYKGKYWHFFGRGGGSMYFVTADNPEGPWSSPTQMRVPSNMPSGLGVDNSIFIDEDTGKWYLLTKAGQPNNHIVELGDDGQPTGKVLDLTWLNPQPYPFGWAEGPVMWKYKGFYYYSFAQHLAGAQYVMRSDTLTDDKSKWTIISSNIFNGTRYFYNTPNHISPAVMLNDSTSWVIAHSYHGNSLWYAQGRQGLLCQVKYNEQGFPYIQYPSNDGVPAPNLPSSGIPWTVPKSDFFESSKLNPEWSFLGYTSNATYSLTERPGWLRLSPKTSTKPNTLIKNDGEHNYSLITKLDFNPESVNHEAGLWIINGPQTLTVKVYSTVNSSGKKVFAFSFDKTYYEVENTIGNIVWLKLIRDEHLMSGYYSADGCKWYQIGQTIDASAIDKEQTQFNNFTGNRQGIYVKGKLAYFDLYIYRDAYTKITAQNPANKLGVSPAGNYLESINNNDWAMYAGVEFGHDDYKNIPDSIEISASSNTTGGIVEVWLDSIDTGRKISECKIENTGGWTKYNIFKAAVVDSVTGSHDVYFRFIGTGTDQLFRINWFRFISKIDTLTSIKDTYGELNYQKTYQLYQNYPNPFNSTTRISFSISEDSFVSLKIYDLLGREVVTLISDKLLAGNHILNWEVNNLTSGIYLCQLKAGNFIDTKKLVLLK